MKLKGIKVEGPNEEVVVFTRDSGKRLLVFKARAVLDNDEFEKLCPEPKPRMIQRPGESFKPDPTDTNYKALIVEHNKKFNDWFNIKSLSATEELEWETVVLDQPDTWKNWSSELKASGLSTFEVRHLKDAVNKANSLDEEMLEKARDSFFKERAAVQPS